MMSEHEQFLLARHRFQSMAARVIGCEHEKRSNKNVAGIVKKPNPESIRAKSGIYCLKVPGFLKVGRSDFNVYKRAKNQMIPTVSLEFSIECDSSVVLERIAHEYLSRNGERIGNTEWFKTDIDTEDLRKALENFVIKESAVIQSANS